MARNAGVQIENNFTKGLVTEATGLNFPENACTDTLNCIFDRTGKVTRRLGIDFEFGHDSTFTLHTNENSVYVEYNWQAVAGQGDLDFVVTQVGSMVFFYQPISNGSLSAGRKPFSIDLNAYKIAGAPNSNSKPAQFASGKGYLFIVHPYCDPVYVKYNRDTNQITTTVITIRIRDFEGLQDGYGVSDRHNYITNEHRYNLYNQGWYGNGNFAQDEELHNQTNGPRVDMWRSRVGWYPANSDVWWVFIEGTSSIIVNWAHRIDLGNTPAPKGHYILNAFYQDRSSVSSVGGLPVTSSGYNRPGSVAFFAGRAFYSAVSANDYGSKVYFSQIIEQDQQLGWCHQANDPTSRYENDLLPSDGGVILIPEAGTIYKMVPVDASLVVFAANGIWSISGSSGAGFSANDYAVKKLAGVETNSATSFVIANGLPIWWNQNGIYAITVDQNLGTLSVASVVDQTIQDFYDEIPSVNKNFAKGAYNALTRRVQWVYRSTPINAPYDQYTYDSVLNFDTTTGAFYPWKISDPGAMFIVGIVNTNGSVVSRDQVPVTKSDGTAVTTAALDPVTSTEEKVTQSSSSFRYTTIRGLSVDFGFLTFSQERGITFRDWVVATGTSGINYDSYFVTGYKIHGEGLRKFQSNYLAVFSEVVPGSSFYVQGQWNFANSGSSGLWSTKQQGYKPSATQEFTWSRLKIRGEGVALQFRVMSEDSKPFNVIGYSVYETSNGAP